MQEPDALSPPHGLMGLEKAAEPWQNPWLWLVAGLIMLFLGTLLYLYKRKQKEAQLALTPSADPWQRLLAELQAVAPLASESPEALEAYYGSLSQLLREGLELRFGFQASSQTLPELEKSLSARTEISGEQRRAWLDFLEQADRIKFAAARSSLSERQSWRDELKNWLQQLSEAR